MDVGTLSGSNGCCLAGGTDVETEYGARELEE